MTTKRPVEEWLRARKRSKKSLASKVSTLERKVALNKPETKIMSAIATGTLATGNIAYLELNYIQQGVNTTERSGSKIKLHYTEYTAGGYTAASAALGLDVYIITCKENAVPVIGDFLGVPGGFPDRDKYMKWRQHITNGPDNNGNIISSHKWQYPMTVHYDGITYTSGIRNRTFLVIKNSAGASINYHMQHRTWFTDP